MSSQNPDARTLIDHLFRHEAGKMVAALTGRFVIEHLSLAEDVVQEALARALQTWPFYGMPKNPAAWIMQTSRNLALDAVRREKVFRDKAPEIIRLIEQENHAPETAVFAEHEIVDDRRRMMFVCCHPPILGELLNDEDEEKFQRVMQAMLQMGKLDITKLKAACAGK